MAKQNCDTKVKHESHAIHFLKRRGAGFGMYGDQGAESLRTNFSTLHHSYCRMKPNSRRLELMMREHLARIHPLAKTLRPEIKRRKNTNEEWIHFIIELA